MKNESFTIEGLAGKKTLKGSVNIRGAKNAALKAMAAAVLFDGPVQLHNVPHTDDIHTMAEVLRRLGAEITWKMETGACTTDGPYESQTLGCGELLEINTKGIHSTDIDPTLAGSMRASVVLTGPLLARFGKVSFPAPGGCVIGARPIDLFIAGYEKMGATVTLDQEKSIYNIVAPKGLRSTDIFFNKQTVGGTETLMMAGVLAVGTTVLKNCAMEPEIVDVAEWLISCGAQISGAGTSTIVIRGTEKVLLKPLHAYVTLPDRITAGSYVILGALCAEELIVKNCIPEHIESVLSFLKGAGVTYEIVPISTKKDSTTHSKLASVRIFNDPHSPRQFSSFSVTTHEYPGFPTDLQPIISVFLTQTSGEGSMFETIFEGRFKYVEDLSLMGAQITVMNPREILIKGPTVFSAVADRELRAHDIRAGFAVVLAALIGKGTYTVNNVHLIDRGYENLEEVLTRLGVHIKRIVV